MESERKVIRVGSRKSPLALIQSEFVVMLLKMKYPDKEFEIIKMSTLGDKILDTALAKIGEKSLFTRALEDAMLEGKVDLVVHSLKDLPTVLPDDLVIGAILKRDDPHDAVVMHPKYQDRTLETLPEGSVIGTSSLRRSSQLRRRFPGLRFEDVRGNINTRLHKLDGGNQYSALVLAAAGLMRMGWFDRITHILKAEDCMYAVSQGALAVECRADDDAILEMVHTISHFETLASVVAERAFLKKLEGGCSVPVAVNTTIEDNVMCMDGGVYMIDGSDCVTGSLKTKLCYPDEPDTKKRAAGSRQREFVSIVAAGMSQDALGAAEQLGVDLAVRIMQDGGKQILDVTKQTMKADIEKMKAEKLAAEKSEKQLKKDMRATTTGKIAKQMTPKPERQQSLI